MQSFARILSIITFLLSFGFIAQALPIPAKAGSLAVREYESPASYGGGSPSYSSPSSSGSGSPSYGSPSSFGSGQPSIDALALVLGLKAELGPVIGKLSAAAELVVAVDAVAEIVARIQVVAVALISVELNVTADVRAKIAAVVLDIWVSIIAACANVTARLGLVVCLTLWAQIDVAFKLLLVALNVAVEGFLAVFVDLCANLSVEVLAQLKMISLKLCVSLLSLTSKVSAVA